MRRLTIPKRSVPTCWMCGIDEGVRKISYGYLLEPAEFICGECFTPRDDHPTFDDLPEALTQAHGPAWRNLIRSFQGLLRPAFMAMRNFRSLRTSFRSRRRT